MRAPGTPPAPSTESHGDLISQRRAGEPPGVSRPRVLPDAPLPRPQALGGRLQLGLNRSVYVTVSAP